MECAATGNSPFPGNINILVFGMDRYKTVLEATCKLQPLFQAKYTDSCLVTPTNHSETTNAIRAIGEWVCACRSWEDERVREPQVHGRNQDGLQEADAPRYCEIECCQRIRVDSSMMLRAARAVLIASCQWHETVACFPSHDTVRCLHESCVADSVRAACFMSVGCVANAV